MFLFGSRQRLYIAPVKRGQSDEVLDEIRLRKRDAQDRTELSAKNQYKHRPYPFCINAHVDRDSKFSTFCVALPGYEQLHDQYGMAFPPVMIVNVQSYVDTNASAQYNRKVNVIIVKALKQKRTVHMKVAQYLGLMTPFVLLWFCKQHLRVIRKSIFNPRHPDRVTCGKIAWQLRNWRIRTQLLHHQTGIHNGMVAPPFYTVLKVSLGHGTTRISDLIVALVKFRRNISPGPEHNLTRRITRRQVNVNVEAHDKV
ncbi:hypothetical protein CLF_105387 [Clonorchis sinensis]|uniref:Uncharacterized protein n=1 Tax=Clonorchis sinensis TaxID=79923 RepID=G7YP88_CLOSI|nr:hypothetical protein CLF_105387 [Clonorchis sinensis]